MRWRRWGIAPAALAAALGCGTDVARAGQATAEAGTVRFADAAGASDRLSATLDLVDGSSPDPAGWNVVFYAVGEPQATPGAGCVAGFVGVLCALGATAPAALTVDLGAGDDALELGLKLNAKAAPTQITIAGGPGNDEIATIRARADIDGGEGDDVIGPDERFANDFPPDPTPGGALRGGPGTDRADYEAALDPIEVSLDDRANDGRRSEGDNVHSDVENVIGSQFGNVLSGSDAANVLTGGAAADRLRGGAGRDTLEGRSGDDTLNALDGAAGDRLDCGEGDDVALADAGDTLLGCERLTRAPGIGSARLRFRGGRVALRLSCPKGATCRGTALLRSAKTLASGSYRISSGKRATIGLRTTSAGRAAFRRAGAAKATLIIQPAGTRDADGRAVTVR
jgi:Ca2+-binding RTX toxin-like protein